MPLIILKVIYPGSLRSQQLTGQNGSCDSHPPGLFSLISCRLARRAAFPECLVSASPRLDSGQSSGRWIRDELAVGGGLSLALKSCWAAICLRVEADEPFCPESCRLGVWLSGIVHWKQLWQEGGRLIALFLLLDELQQLASVERNFSFFFLFSSSSVCGV